MKFATLMAVIFVSIFLVNAANASSDITYTAACTVLTKQSNNSTQHFTQILWLRAFQTKQLANCMKVD